MIGKLLLFMIIVIVGILAFEYLPRAIQINNVLVTTNVTTYTSVSEINNFTVTIESNTTVSMYTKSFSLSKPVNLTVILSSNKPLNITILNDGKVVLSEYLMKLNKSFSNISGVLTLNLYNFNSTVRLSVILSS
ncbi:hypothetical protein SUSAZ_06185 [Sulfolobus acidocaldarius SUSAZ]|nr:hypothetical protein SUSAZ_06185 [Sulfolobus acidocaldarius SUSAZ]